MKKGWETRQPPHHNLDQSTPTIAVSDRDGALAEIGFSDERVDEHRVSLASVALQQYGRVSGGGGG